MFDERKHSYSADLTPIILIACICGFVFIVISVSTFVSGSSGFSIPEAIILPVWGSVG